MNEAFYAPRFDIRVSGVTLAADVTDQVVRLRYENDLDLASMFSLVLRNPDNRLLDSALCDLGKTVEIHMGYGRDLQPMMLGEIASVEPSFPDSGAPTVTINGYDKSYRMRHNQPEPKQYRFLNDSLIAAQIAVENGLIPIVDPSPIVHLQCPIHQTESDMAFLKARALENFFDVYVWWDKLYFQFPRPQGKAYVLEWGKNLSRFSPRIAGSGMAGLQVVRGYSAELAESVVAFAVAGDFNPENIKEKLGSAGLELLMSLGRRFSRTGRISSPINAFLLAKSLLQDVLEGLYEGSGSCIGIPDLRAGKYIEIRGIGKRFSGTYRLRKVTHTIDESGYHTSFEVTQRSGANLLGLLRKKLLESPSPNQKERFHGLAIGKVTSNVETLDAPPAVPPMSRVKVTFPGISEKLESCWARCAMPMSGKDMGMYFLPEPGDEVLLGFEDGDLSQPMVLGSLWNGQKAPPVSGGDPLNSLRVIKSKSGHTITLDDNPVAPKLVIEHKTGSSITLDAKGGIVIHGTTIELNADTTMTLKANSIDVQVGTTMNVH